MSEHVHNLPIYVKLTVPEPTREKELIPGTAFTLTKNVEPFFELNHRRTIPILTEAFDLKNVIFLQGTIAMFIGCSILDEKTLAPHDGFPTRAWVKINPVRYVFLIGRRRWILFNLNLLEHIY